MMISSDIAPGLIDYDEMKIGTCELLTIKQLTTSDYRLLLNKHIFSKARKIKKINVLLMSE